MYYVVYQANRISKPYTSELSYQIEKRFAIRFAATLSTFASFMVLLLLVAYTSGGGGGGGSGGGGGFDYDYHPVALPTRFAVHRDTVDGQLAL